VVSPPGLDRPVRLCARCSGVYPGIAVGALGAATGLLPVSVLLVAVLPVFALVDWLATTAGPWDGSNAVRTATGLLLGGGYGVGLVGLLAPATRWPILLVGVGYATAAGVAVALVVGRDRQPLR
jgi:uncharacterized membrane protein